mmetsp:Transcript_21394/g.44538  ORF Transcript_21394/g.44538 Transcript_21394/m.44538 type:complete len:450 (+) Transcript_21394:838-2187(+)
MGEGVERVLSVTLGNSDDEIVKCALIDAKLLLCVVEGKHIKAAEHDARLITGEDVKIPLFQGLVLLFPILRNPECVNCSQVLQVHHPLPQLGRVEELGLLPWQQNRSFPSSIPRTSHYPFRVHVHETQHAPLIGTCRHLQGCLLESSANLILKSGKDVNVELVEAAPLLIPQLEDCNDVLPMVTDGVAEDVAGVGIVAIIDFGIVHLVHAAVINANAVTRFRYPSGNALSDGVFFPLGLLVWAHCANKPLSCHIDQEKRDRRNIYDIIGDANEVVHQLVHRLPAIFDCLHAPNHAVISPSLRHHALHEPCSVKRDPSAVADGLNDDSVLFCECMQLASLPLVNRLDHPNCLPLRIEDRTAHNVLDELIVRARLHTIDTNKLLIISDGSFNALSLNNNVIVIHRGDQVPRLLVNQIEHYLLRINAVVGYAQYALYDILNRTLLRERLIDL